MINIGDYNHTKIDEDTSDIDIYDTVIKTCRNKLQEYLRENKIVHTNNDAISIKKISNDQLTDIYSKFLYSKQKLSNMIFIDGTKIMDDFDDIDDFLTRWINARYVIYKLRKNKILL